MVASKMVTPKKILLISCGALASTLKSLLKQNQWDFIKLECLPAIWHNHPEKIVPGLKQKIALAKTSKKFNKILVAYGDCGTKGELDKLLDKSGAVRIKGNHCYEFFTGSEEFEKIFSSEIGSFYLSDYLVTFFDKLILDGLGIKKHPHLRDIYFKNYKKLVYLAQTNNIVLQRKAKLAADFLGLEYSYKFTGYKNIELFINHQLSNR